MTLFRVATYNVHKCIGLDWRARPERIAAVIREFAPDILALQEVLSEQARFLAEALGLSFVLGENRVLDGCGYGNALLSRFPLAMVRNHDLTVTRCEPRGCLQADIDARGRVLRVFNAHLGTSFFERRKQAPRLVADEVIKVAGPRIVLGDFNEWTRGVATRMLAARFQTADLRLHLRRTRTYPGLLPVLNLDHIYFDPDLKLDKLTLHRSRTALAASDHLPLVADFTLAQPCQRSPR